LSRLLLILSLEVKAKYCLVHYPGKKRNLFNLLLFRHSAQFILQCNSNFGFQESFLLLATHITKVPKRTEYVKFWNFDFGTDFGTLIHAQTLDFGGVFLSVSKTVVFGTRLECLIKATELLVIGFLGSSLSSGAARGCLRIRQEAPEDGIGDAPFEAP
jgi:hypothetical protein